MIDPDAPGYRKREYRAVIALVCIAAAVGLAYAGLSERWLENTRARPLRVEFSLLSSRHCFEWAGATECESTSNTDMMTELAMQGVEGASTTFAMAGKATLGLLAISALALFACGVWVGLGRRTKGVGGPQHAALLALTLALLAATAFIKLKPGGTTVATGVGAGPGFWVFAVACIVGIFGAQFASSRIKPVDAL